MPVQIISRAKWGAQPWNGTPAVVPLSKRREFYVHYDGATPITATGHAVPRAIDRQHQAQRWAGIGYNFVVDQAGHVYEGRGWDRQGAHCPGHNVSGIGVQIAVGGDQEPSEAALAACRALYDEACRRTGRFLAMRGHRDGIATLCPGPHLYTWVQAGMPAPDGTTAPHPGPARYQRTISGLTYGYGAKGPHVTAVGRALVKAGHGDHYRFGPGPNWTDADTLNYASYQRALGYSGGDADGVPGKASLRQLLGKTSTASKPKPSPPPFPGRGRFGPGQNNAHVTVLGRQLVKRGYGKHYKSGPGPRWSDADRRNVAAFQRAQGWTGRDADGYPGPETWRRLFA